MANVKSRLKAPKSASTKKKKKVRGKARKSLTGPKKAEFMENDKKCDIGESVHWLSDKVMPSQEKLQYVLKNGHTLQDKFVVKPPVTIKNTEPRKHRNPFYERKKDSDHPLVTKSHIKKKVKCNLKLIDSILMNELMISDSESIKNSKSVPPLLSPPVFQPASSPSPLLPSPSMSLPSSPFLPPSPVASNNNNDNQITDQNDPFVDYSDDSSEYKLTGDNSSDTSQELSDDTNFSEDSIAGKVAKKHKNQKRKLEPIKKQLRQKQVTLKPVKKHPIPKKDTFKPIKKNPKQKKNTLEPIKNKTKLEHITLKNGEVLFTYFECDHCKKTFNRKSSLLRHMFLHLNIRSFSCEYCDHKFISKYNLHVHMKRYHGTRQLDQKIITCNYCEKSFLMEGNLKEHLTTDNTSGNPFKCIYCNTIFKSLISLMLHEKQHMVNGRHQCTICGVAYVRRNSLYLHLKGHLKINTQHNCQYCSKELMPDTLTQHLETSNGPHRIVCPICKKKLKGHLSEHMRTHEKKRPHECPDCGQRFTQSTQLNVHRRAHTGARPYPCRICKRFFSHSNALMLHIRRHTGEKPFPCALCPLSFSQLPHMKTHMRKIHGQEKPYKCPKCDSFFKLKSQLDVHANTCPAAKGKKKGGKIEVEAQTSLSRMRFLLALLLTMIASTEKLKYLGFNKRPIDEILIESLEAMSQIPCKDETLSPLKRLKTNIDMLLNGTVPKEQMGRFKKEHKSTEDILALLTNEKNK